MDQTILNWLFSGVSMLFGFFMHALWNAIKDLQKNDKDLVDKVSEIEVLVAGQYIKRDEVDRRIEDLTKALFTKLDRIEEKLDKKADKNG